MDYRPPASSVCGIFYATILEWVAISFSRESSWPRYQTCVSCIDRHILYHWATREAQEVAKLDSILSLSDSRTHAFKKVSKFESEGRRPVFQLKHSDRKGEWILLYSAFLLYSGHPCIGRGLPHWGGQSASLSLPIQMLVSLRKTFIDTPKIMFNQISGHPVAQSSWHKINHHTCLSLHSYNLYYLLIFYKTPLLTFLLYLVLLKKTLKDNFNFVEVECFCLLKTF